MLKTIIGELEFLSIKIDKIDEIAKYETIKVEL